MTTTGWKARSSAAVIHSPFCDDYHLCCDQCPKAIEVSFYDPVCKAAVDQLPGSRTWEDVMAALEPLLRSCSCGGRFRGNSPRRCFMCGATVPSAAGKDLSPYLGCEDGSRDPTAEQQATFDRFEAEFVGREGLWANSHDGDPDAAGDSGN
jgi:hypothetical protein